MVLLSVENVELSFPMIHEYTILFLEQENKIPFYIQSQDRLSEIGYIEQGLSKNLGILINAAASLDNYRNQ